MSIPNQCSSIMDDGDDDCMIPLDLRYSNFLQSLSDIRDEGMRDRCHQYWTSLYRYLDRSMANERALILEEKRTHEILHRLDIEMVSHQSEMTYQVQDILQRGHHILSDFHLKYKRKKSSSKDIDDNSLASDLNTTSPSAASLTNMIDHLKLEIKNLQMMRETFQRELNNKRTSYFSTHITAYHIEQKIHQMTRELNEIQHELTLNLRTTDERNNQLIQLHLHQQNIEYQSIIKQIDHEQKLSFQLKEQNKELNYRLSDHRTLWKTHKHHESELNTKTKDLLEKIHLTQEQIQIEKSLQHDLSQIFSKLKKQLKQKQKLLSKHQYHKNHLKHQILQLEHHRTPSPQHLPFETLDNIKVKIHQEHTHRLKLTITYHNLKQQINNLEHITQEYSSLVKDQRQKVIHYERLHDQWILNITSNRNRLLKLFNRMNILQQHLITTSRFLEHFDQMKISLKPTVLIIYNQMNIFLQQRREKNEIEIIEGKCSLNLKYSQMKKISKSNQIILNEIKQNISSINRNHPILLNQISTIEKQKFHLIEHLNLLQNQSLIKQQQILDIQTKFNQIKHSIDLNNQKLHRLTFEKQNISSFLLKKQHCIVLLHQHIESNKRIPRLNFSPLIKKIHQIRNEIKHERQSIQFLKTQDQIDLKHLILSLRKDLFEYKKKNNHFQHRIHRQIFTHKSFIKENNEQSRIDLQRKISSIIYRLICKTHLNILLHQRHDLLMQNILILYSFDQSTHKNHHSTLFYSDHLNKKLKSSIAELRILKNEILLYQQIYMNIKSLLVDDNFSRKTGTRLCDG